MTILPRPADGPEVGIVIHAGRPALRPTTFWAYLWATDDEDPPSSNERPVAHTRIG